MLDPDDESFKEDFLKFQDRILELDMKLAAILCQAFGNISCLNVWVGSLTALNVDVVLLIILPTNCFENL